MAKSTKKTVAKKPAPKKVVAKKPIAKKPAPKKAVAKKPVAKKPVAKKPVAKKPAPKKVVAKKPIAKKPVAKKPVAKKPAPKKVVAKKPVAKKPAPKKVVAKKPVAKKPAAKKPVAKKPAPKKVVAKKPAAKPVAKKVIAKKPAAKPVAKKPAPVVKKPAPKPIAKTVAKKVVEVKKPESPKAFSRPVEIKKPAPVVKAEPKKAPSYSKPAPAIIRDNVDEQIAGKTRYSDKELVEFKDLINNKITVAKEELANLIDQMQNPGMNNGDDSDNSYKTLEDGSSTAEKEYISQLAARQRKFIENLENALIRIENKTYGICRVTGKLISKERLRAVPHTTLSMEAKVQQYK